MASKPHFPKSQLAPIDEINITFFEAYETMSKNKKGDYAKKVKEFLQFCAYKSNSLISDINKAEVEAYIKVLKDSNFRTATVELRLSAITHFRDFLLSNFSEYFRKNFLEDLPTSIDNNDEKRPKSRVLSLKQISLIKRYNHRKNKSIKDELIFALFFQLNLDKKDIPALLPNIDNPYVQGLLEKVPISKLKTGTVDSYFSRVTKYLKEQKVYEESERNINSYDLTLSHEAYFFTCPNCQRVFENLAENWVLAKTEYDESYRIVCGICKGE